jgi:carboxyl-terminal processing protease
MRNFGEMRGTVTAVLAAALAAAVACGSSTDKWTGSVDAVFRYRPADRSTVVHEVRPQSRSELAGLKAGDRVLTVDGTDVTELPYGEVRAAMRGPVGTVALLTIQREGQLIEVQIERRPIKAATEDD